MTVKGGRRSAASLAVAAFSRPRAEPAAELHSAAVLRIRPLSCYRNSHNRAAQITNVLRDRKTNLECPLMGWTGCFPQRDSL